MRVDHAVRIVAHGVDGAVNDKASQVYRVIGSVQDVALQIDFHQVPGGNLGVVQTVGVDEKMRLSAWNAEGDVVVDHLGPALGIDETIERRQLEPKLPLFSGHAM